MSNQNEEQWTVEYWEKVKSPERVKKWYGTEGLTWYIEAKRASKVEIEQLRSELKQERLAVDFYAPISRWSHRDYSNVEVERNCFNVYEDFQSFNNLGGENPVIKIKGKLARETQAKRKVEL